jgi:hypothetical protein
LEKLCGINAEWLEMKKSLKEAIEEISALRDEFYKEVLVPGNAR